MYCAPPIYLSHSAKGSTWEDHKYVERIDGTYYYPSGYTKGRTIDSLKGKPEEDTGSKEESDLSDEDVENLAMEVIRGNFANGRERREALGEYYNKIQNRVNQLMKGLGGVSISQVSGETVEKGESQVKKPLPLARIRWYPESI